MARTRAATTNERVQRDQFMAPIMEKISSLTAVKFKYVPEECKPLWDEINEFDKKNGFVITHSGLRKIIGGEK